MATASKEKAYTCSTYFKTFMDGLSVIRDEFCDARLVAGGKIFLAHKVILAAHSRYFHSIFVQHFNERELDEIKMPPEINAEAMQTLLDYFYSGNLTLSQDNIESLFIATDYMRLDPLLEICIEYMHETLDSSNCVCRYIVSDPIQYSSQRLDGLKKSASALIVEEAVNVPELPGFLSLSVELILKITKLNKESAKAEDVYMVIMKWIKHDEENRGEFLSTLLETLSIEGISNGFFTHKLRNEDLIRRDVKSVQWLLDVCTSRLAVSLEPSRLFITERGYSLQTKCFYLNLTQISSPLEICEKPEIQNFSTFCHKKRIYLFAGDRTGESFQLDESKKSWVASGLNLDFGRYNAGCIVHGQDLYVIGGSNIGNQDILNSCMKFNFGSGRTDILPAMRDARSIPGVALYANSIYAANGEGSSATIERFDPREGRWFTLEWYYSRTNSCSSAVWRDSLYTCDIDSGNFERFDLRMNQSAENPPISSMYDFSPTWIASVDGNLFGINHDYIVKYEEAVQGWTVLGSVMDFEVPIILPWV